MVAVPLPRPPLAPLDSRLYRLARREVRRLRFEGWLYENTTLAVAVVLGLDPMGVAIRRVILSVFYRLCVNLEEA